MKVFWIFVIIFYITKSNFVKLDVEICNKTKEVVILNIPCS